MAAYLLPANGWLCDPGALSGRNEFLGKHRVPQGPWLRPARSARHLALGLLLSLRLSSVAFGKDNGDDDDDTAKPKPTLPNFYLDMRTIYSTVPAGALSFGFSSISKMAAYFRR
jgi:hypothetical protein